MNKTGQITKIVPDGGYQGQNGYINTFQMTIQCPDGTLTGQIGAKSAIYPMAVGETINVEVMNTQHGVRLKKFNPQYAQADQNASPQGTQEPQQASGGRVQPYVPQGLGKAETKTPIGSIAPKRSGGQGSNGSFALSYAKDLMVAIIAKFAEPPNELECAKMVTQVGQVFKDWLDGKPTEKLSKPTIANLRGTLENTQVEPPEPHPSITTERDPEDDIPF